MKVNKSFWANERKYMSHVVSLFIDEAMEEILYNLLENVDDISLALKE